MIEISKPLIRRKEMDSVLTCLVDNNFDAIGELIKSIKKLYNCNSIDLYRSYYESFRAILESSSTEDAGEIIISALAPFYLYKIIHENGYTPIVIDVSDENGQPEIDLLLNKINENTKFIVYIEHFCPVKIPDELKDINIPIIEFLFSGFGFDIENNIIPLQADYTIISLESDAIVNSMGGSVLAYDIQNKELQLIYKQNSHLQLSGLNASLAISLLNDIDLFVEKKNKISLIYKNSLFKSEYKTLVNIDSNCHSYFPIILNKSIKDVQLYIKNFGVEFIKAYENSIINKVRGLDCKKAKSLNKRVLLFPISLTMNKSSIELISKILSTLP